MTTRFMTTTSQQLGSYLMDEPIGRSGLAMVHRGEHVPSGRAVVLKIIHRYFASESEVLKAFFGELV